MPGAPRAARASAAGRFDRQEAIGAEYLRMSLLQRMSYAELSALLSGDPFRAASWIETAAHHGMPQAQLRLGQMRLDGLGGRKSEADALDWFTRASGRGSPEAMNMVGRCCENGWGMQEDLAAAAHWYRRSADAGHDWGQYNYANMLFDGRGVTQDQVEAVGWYRRAADQGHARAMNLLARCCEEGWGTPRDPAAALQWYRRSAEGGYFRAQFNYGAVLASYGRIDEALGWFDKACRDAPEGSLSAMLALLLRQEHPRLRAFARAIIGEPSEAVEARP